MIEIEGESMSTHFQLFEGTSTADGKSLKIGELSKRSGVGVEALRFYEKSGLLDRPSRTHSGYRVYRENALQRLNFIKKAQLLGFTLDEIKALIDHKRMGENPCSEVRSIVRKRLEALNNRIEQMVTYRDELSSELGEWEKKGTAAGHVCGLIEGSSIEHGLDHRKLGRKS